MSEVGGGHLLVRPECHKCGKPATSVELVPPHRLPAHWEKYPQDEQELFSRYRDPNQWWFISEGICRGNGIGDQISSDEASVLIDAFSGPPNYDSVHKAGLYDDAGFCRECGVAYCYRHWNVSQGGYGHCPSGHGKGLDPHWSPDDYD